MKKPRWTEEEITMLKKYWGHKKPAEIAEILGRTKIAVRNKARDICLYIKKESKFKKDKFTYKKGDRVIIKYHPQIRGIKGTKECRIIGIYDNFFTVQFQNWKESFLRADIVTGEIKIKKVA